MEAPGEETFDQVGEVNGDDSHCGDNDGEDDIAEKVCTSLLILQLFFNIFLKGRGGQTHVKKKLTQTTL